MSRHTHAHTHTHRSLLPLVLDVLSVFAIVDVFDVRGSAIFPSGGEAAAWPLAVVRLQVAVLREEVVLQLVLSQALPADRTLHLGVDVFDRKVRGAIRPEVVLNVGGGDGGQSDGSHRS